MEMHRKAAASSAPARQSKSDQPKDKGVSYFDIVRSISNDPDVRKAVDDAEAAERRKSDK